MTLKSSVEEILNYLGLPFKVEDTEVPHGTAVKIEDFAIITEYSGAYTVIRIDTIGGIWNLPLEDPRCFDRTVARAIGVVVSEKIQLLRAEQMDSSPRLSVINLE